MTELGEEPTDSPDDDDVPTELERELAQQAERPAPLFAKKEPQPTSNADAAASPPRSAGSGGQQEAEDVEKSVATIQAPDEGEVANGGEDGAGKEGLLYETEADGRTPVVGDLLKIRFVEWRVVPTILVSALSLLSADLPVLLQACMTHMLCAFLGLLLPLPVEQLPP